MPVPPHSLKRDFDFFTSVIQELEGQDVSYKPQEIKVTPKMVESALWLLEKTKDYLPFLYVYAHDSAIHFEWSRVLSTGPEIKTLDFWVEVEWTKNTPTTFLATTDDLKVFSVDSEEDWDRVMQTLEQQYGKDQD